MSRNEPRPFRLLLLGGTGEARQLAERLARDPRLVVVTSLAGRTRAPVLPAGPVRVGGFGGEEGLAGFLREERIDAVLDATHPFARRITRTAHDVCARLGLPYLRLERPPWQPVDGDLWTVVPDLEAGLAAACREGSTVFANIGRADWPRLRACRQCRFVIRTVEPCDPPAPHVVVIAGRPPYTVEGDRELLLRFGVDRLLLRNAGGAGAYPKLVAARELGLPVVMIERPVLDVAPSVPDVDAAQLWLEGLLRGLSR